MAYNWRGLCQIVEWHRPHDDDDDDEMLFRYIYRASSKM